MLRAAVGLGAAVGSSPQAIERPLTEPDSPGCSPVALPVPRLSSARSPVVLVSSPLTVATDFGPAFPAAE